MKTYFVLIFIFIVLSFFGCASSSSFSFFNEGISTSKATSETDIVLYTSSDIGRPYLELGGVSATYSDELDGKKYVKLLKKEAAKMGADAIIKVRQVGNSTSGIAVKFQ